MPAALYLRRIERAPPHPPALALLQQIVDAGYAAAVPDPVTRASTLTITETGRADVVAATRLARAANLEVDAHAFEHLQEVLRGERRIALDGLSSKTLSFLFRPETDGVANPEHFGIHFGPRKRRRPSTYFPRTSPRIVSEILTRGSVAAISVPVVIGLPAGTIPATADLYDAWSYEAKLVWIVPGADLVKIIVRPCPEPLTVAFPFVQPIPSEGPLALREMPLLVPEYQELTAATPCPHCGTPATRYRKVGGALICLACHLSFE
jgi:hypothetical protein